MLLRTLFRKSDKIIKMNKKLYKNCRIKNYSTDEYKGLTDGEKKFLIGFFFGTCSSFFVMKKTGVSFIGIVPPNHIGYTNLFGNISEKKYESGWHFINPFSEMLQLSLMENHYCNKLTVSTSEGLELTISVEIIYSQHKDKAKDIYLKYKDESEKILFDTIIRTSLRRIMTRYQAKDLYNEMTRQAINDEFVSYTKPKLIENGFNVSEIVVSKILLPSELRRAIELKLEKEQENERIDFEIEKNRKIAEFEKEKTLIEAERKEIEAIGIQKFQDIVVQGVDNKFIQWKAIEATKELANSDNTKIVVIGNKSTNGLPLLLGSQ